MMLMVALMLMVPLLHGFFVAVVTVGHVLAVLFCVALGIATLFLVVKLIRSLKALLHDLKG